MVEQHGGFIDVESSPGIGTTFSVYLPVAEGEDKGKKEPAANTGEAQGGAETILFVEDEEALRDIANELLAASGYTLLLASTGREGLRRFLENKDRIDLVLTDYGMPEMTGGDLLRAVRAESSSVPIVIVSGFLDPDLKGRLTEDGASAFVHKPLRAAELLRTIRHILDKEKGSG